MTDGTYYSRARAKIIYILATGLQSLSDDCEMSSIVIKTAAAVRDLDPGHGGAGALQYNFWFMVVDVATAIPHEHRGHSFLVELLANLDSSAGEEVSCEDEDYEEVSHVSFPHTKTLERSDAISGPNCRLEGSSLLGSRVER